MEQRSVRENLSAEGDREKIDQGTKQRQGLFSEAVSLYFFILSL